MRKSLDIREELTVRQTSRPRLLNTLLALGPYKVGDLIRLARSVPPEFVEPIAVAMGEAVKASAASGRCAARRRRQLVILATLLSRIAFELEGIPKDPGSVI